VVFYYAYELTSNATAGGKAQATANALREVRLERSLGIFVEQPLQAAMLHYPVVIELCNLYYTTVHFVMPVVALLWLYFKVPERYLPWRNALAWSTAIAFVVFIVFPVAPPRLLPARFHFVDTVVRYGGGSPIFAILMKNAGNPYAAMPSLHVAWALWCAAALAPAVRPKWLKALIWADPVITTFVVFVTANHLIVDAVAGVVVCVIGILLGRRAWFRPLFDRFVAERLGARRRGDAWDALASADRDRVAEREPAGTSAFTVMPALAGAPTTSASSPVSRPEIREGPTSGPERSRESMSRESMDEATDGGSSRSASGPRTGAGSGWAGPTVRPQPPRPDGLPPTATTVGGRGSGPAVGPAGAGVNSGHRWIGTISSRSVGAGRVSRVPPDPSTDGARESSPTDETDERERQ
jgi:hypothetical protein